MLLEETGKLKQSESRIPSEWLQKLKEIHYNKTSIELSDIEVTTLGLDILNYLELVGPTPPTD